MERPVLEPIKQVEKNQRAMSLLNEAMTDCILMDKKTTPDGYGGYTTTWTEGALFRSAIVLDNSVEGLQAQAMGVTGLYTVTTQRQMNLQYHDVFKRVDDGKIFRVTTDGDDDKTPFSAGLNMRQVRAEEWELT